MKLYEKFNFLSDKLIIPFIFSGAFAAVNEIMMLIADFSDDSVNTIVVSIGNVFIKLISYVFCYYLTGALCEKNKILLGFLSILCLSVFSSSFTAVSGESISFFGGIFVGAVISAIIKYIKNNTTGFLFSFAVSLLFGLLFGFLYEYYNDINMYISSFISGKGIFSAIFFAIVNAGYSIFDSSNFADLFFYKSYGGSIFFDNNIVTGVKDLLDAGYNGKLISTYLSGHYYLMFSVFGICLSLLQDLKKIKKKILIFLIVCTAVSGNFSLIYLFLFLESPALFVSIIIISALAYGCAYLIDLGFGFLHSGSLIELFIYNGNIVYLLAGGTVFFAIGYFVYKYCYEKYGISECCSIYVPEKLRFVVDALGGIKNIIRYRDDKIEVRNPKLVNTILLECEINENVIECKNDQLIQLKEYLNGNQGGAF